MTARCDVLLISNNFPPVRGGSGVVYASLARSAPDRISVLAPSISYADGRPLIGWREHDRMAPYRVTRLPLLRTVMPATEPFGVQKLRLVARDIALRIRLSVSVLALIARTRPRAVCIGELLASGWLLQLLRLIPGLHKLVYVHREEITTDDQYDPKATRRRRALLAADCIIVVSRFTEQAVRTLLDQQGHIVLIENGVDTTRFCPAQRTPELVARYDLEGRFVFVTVCRLLEKKGVDQALRAFAALRQQHPGLCYLIVGDGPYEPDLRNLVAELQIGDAVRFAGNVPEHELVAHYRLGDVFVMPNRALPNGDTEGFGLVFLEANACGLPVIAGDLGGSTDAVRDGENGLVVDGNAVLDIQVAMQRLLQDKTLRDTLARQGLARARAADWVNRTKAFLQVCVGG